MYALVRHAHAGDKKAWTGPDERRPLSRRGQQQAEGIAGTLSAMAVTRLVSSPYLRCVQSLQPLAARLNLPIQTSEHLGPDATAAELDALLADPAMEGAVLCTHGETLKALLARWQDRRLLEVAAASGRDDGHSTEKGATWIVETESESRTIHYLRPVEVGPSLRTGANTWPEMPVG